MSNNLQLEKQLCFRLYSLNKLMCRLYAPLLKELALTYPQYLVMMVLWQYRQGISVKDLGGQLDLDSGTLSPLLKRMEKQALIKRERQTKDERIVLIKLTQAGIDLQQSAEHIPAKMFAVTGLSAEKLQALNLTLDQLIENIAN
ncbi:MarR family transcriptional regulator [Colwellia sp. MT41]|uniref:MarR family transcriptional regulator n=1 Tax=Colwellia marinimaniae TaxID=1513592 RepID=A0ABQ0MX42_9GAMM|nr:MULTISPECIES: MarR family transcriptional regulator [Colwellia]ALO35156.1 MarR family transcriptional regulator [Colwellia sp. MT41]GAW96931.1 MarR family transcriptional regulator [Colwellia marinimaniae]